MLCACVMGIDYLPKLILSSNPTICARLFQLLSPRCNRHRHQGHDTTEDIAGHFLAQDEGGAHNVGGVITSTQYYLTV